MMKSIKQHLYVFTQFKLWELLFYGIVIAILNVLASYLYEPLLNNIGKNHFTHIALILIVCTLIKLLLIRQQMVRKNELNFDIEMAQTQTIFSQLAELNGDRTITSDMGKWLTITGTDSKQYAYLYAYTLPEMIVGFVGFIGALVYGFNKSIILTAIIMLISFVIYSLSKFLSKQVHQSTLQEKEEVENFQPTLLSILNGRLLLKALRKFEFGFELFEQRFIQYRDAQLKRQKASIFLESISMGTGFILTVVWMSAAFLLIVYGKMSIGEFMGFYALDASFNWIFMSFPSLYSAYVEGKVSVYRLESFNDEMFNVQEQNHLSFTDFETIELMELSYCYHSDNEKNHFILDDLNLTIHKGDKLAIRGESGSGKSTLIQILIGYLRQYQGQIKVNGQVVDAVQLGNFTSYIPQSNVIVNANLRENILLGRQVSDRELNQVCVEVGLQSLIDKLEFGLDTQLSAGLQQNLSEGEIQRIGLARALVENREILILDEPTSALDVKNEEQIVNLLERLNKTIIIITHRESTIPYGFRQVELRQGNLIDCR
ncbi:ABC transporter ATP-binding protein [Aerococcaceae bacterium zg-ZJ1578]|uniref:ATP-binding cassette domain-containing protein n=1 Tax=Aerococcaceae bacterium zg-252 TaxID=2796928 RepID=UPI001A24A5E5|nr:ABC transporter ATP-binding protein [Aerococcaceae bacterium zg-1578]